MKKALYATFLGLVLLGSLVRGEAVIHNVTGTGTYVFGTTGVTMNFLSLTGSGQVRVENFLNTPPNLPTSGKPVEVYWAIQASVNITAFTAVFTFTYTDSQYMDADITDPTSLYCARDSSTNGDWKPYVSVSDTASNTVSCTTNHFSFLWGLGGTGGPLPVTLASFTATRQAGQVQLNWTTYCEQDNLGFNVLRSSLADGQFIKINSALIPGAGTTSLQQTYRYIDYTALNTTYWYKVEQLDLGGASTLSGAIQVAGETGIDDFVLPVANISGQSRIYNLLGRQMETGTLQPGIYLVLEKQGKVIGKKAVIK